MRGAWGRPVALWLLLAAIAHGQEAQLDCYDGPFENVLLDGCVDDCQSYETLVEAENHCNSIDNCGGITKTSYGDQEAISLGVGLYEVRAGPGIESANGDHTWIKQAGCSGALGGTQGAALGDLNRLVGSGQLTPVEGTLCRTFSAAVEGQYLEGCVDECRSFETLQEAEDHCDQVADCGGVTHSLYGEGQAWHDGMGPYEVRMGPALKPSKDGDISWVRIEHDCNDPDFSEGLSGGGWASSFASNVNSAESSMASTFTWMLVLVGLCGGLVYLSYRQGHPMTIDYVDRARFKVQQIMGRGGIPGTSAYESL